MENSVIFSLQGDISLFLIIGKFLVALRFGKFGVQVLGLKCLFCLLWETGSAVALTLLVISHHNNLEQYSAKPGTGSLCFPPLPCCGVAYDHSVFWQLKFG